MNGDVRVGFPWHSLIGFVQSVTHPKIFTAPMTGREARSYVDEWLDQPAPPMTPTASRSHA